MQPIKVLLIDDERLEREGLAYLCRKLPYSFEFAEAKNGQEGLTRLAEQAFDIVIVDIRMPVMGGLPFLEQATKRYPAPKYIIYSAHSDFDVAREAINLQVEDYLLKPIEEEDFFALINKVLSKLNAQRREAQERLIGRAIRGLGDPQQDDQRVLGSVAGTALLLFLEEPVLDTLGDDMAALTHRHFPSAFVLIGNEQECSIVMLDKSAVDQQTLEALMADINADLHSACQVVVSAPFGDYQQMKEALHEGQQLMSRGFFTKSNVILRMETMQEAEEDFSFYGQEVQPVTSQDNPEEIVSYIMRVFERTGAYSNLYTKYMLVKQVERYVQQVSPALIEQMLASRSIGEFRQAVEQIVRENPREISLTEAAKTFIAANYSRDLSIDDIADSVFISSNYLCAVFKRETGSTLISYLTQVRMDRAMDLVSNSMMKVGDIAKAVGYNNPSYFNMIFKNHFGNTPTAIRRGEA